MADSNTKIDVPAPKLVPDTFKQLGLTDLQEKDVSV